MKTKFTLRTLVMLVLITAVLLIVHSCQKENQNPVNPASGGLTQDLEAKSPAIPVPSPPAYNLDVKLAGLAAFPKAFGTIAFRQEPDTTRIIALNIAVYHLMPNHAYILERAVDPFSDITTCSSTAWLKLGKGLVAQSIHTGREGNGTVALWRNVTAIARETAFHIHFQVIDSLTSVPVLSSDCYNYKIR